MTRYHVTQAGAHGATAYTLTDADRKAEAVIYPALGCNAVIFRTTPDNGDGSDLPTDVFLPPDSIEDLRTVPFLGGNPILFPFPNRVRDGAYEWEGKQYRMEKLLNTGWDRGAGQAIHGLVGDKEWTVEDARADDASARLRCSLQLDDFPDIAEQYPFGCRITVTYELRDGVLHMITDVANTGTGTLPMGFGVHPWFPVALQPGAALPESLSGVTQEQRERAEVRVPCAGLWELKDLMPTGDVLPVEGSAQFDLRTFRPLANFFFDNVWTNVERGADGSSEGGLRDPNSGLEFYLGADAGFREWVLYAPLERPVIALEPYTCATDAVNLALNGVDAGLLSLAPGETWTGHLTFGLRRSNA